MGKPRGLSDNLHVQLKAVIADHVKNEFPRRRRGPSLHSSIPLWAWIRGAHCKTNKIESVVRGETSPPYSTYGVYRKVACERLAAKYPITHVQVHFLSVRLMDGYYSGTVNLPADIVGCYPKWDGGITRRAAHESTAMFCEALKLLNLKAIDVPLRALLDPLVTNLILLKQLQSTVRPTRRTVWN